MTTKTTFDGILKWLTKSYDRKNVPMSDSASLFKDETPHLEADFIPYSLSSFMEVMFPTTLSLVIVIAGLVCLAFLSYAICSAIFPKKNGVHSIRNASWNATPFVITLLFVFVTAMLATGMNSTKIVEHNAQEIMNNHEFNNIKLADNFIEQLPEYKEQLNDEYNPEDLMVFEADSPFGNFVNPKIHIFMDAKSGATAIKALTPAGMGKLESTK